MLFFDVFWPLLAFLGTAWLFWGEWLLILGFAALDTLLAVACVTEDRRELRREQRWAAWLAEHAAPTRTDTPKD